MTRYSASYIRKKYPIDDRFPDWFFRVTEVSAGVYLAEGTDRAGRTVSDTGADPDQLLERCVSDAASELRLENHWQRGYAFVLIAIIHATRNPPVTLAHILAMSEAI